MERFTVLDLLDLDLKEHDALNLKCIGGRPGLANTITIPEINRPGLALSGFFENFAHHRIQVFGRGEMAYIEKLDRENKLDTIHRMFSFKIPAIIFTYNLTPPQSFVEIVESSDCAILRTDIPSSEFSLRLIRELGTVFAPRKTIHGVLVEVFGIGILIMGSSGVGKSESALELIERGHRLIADDSIELHCVSGNILMGEGSNAVAAHHMEIRGLGIINVKQLFGVGAIRDSKQVQLIVNLEEWDNNKVYDRLGSGDNTTEILGVQVPTVLIPVKPGRNIPVIIETAAMNERLKKMGYYSAKEFNQNILRWLESENARNVYFHKKDVF
ncbi:MAG: HPr kinase/phosphorylase [Spirochaetales bacterium]|nr:HPr kinase/phosphorylase [Spirochaetales bacterium]